jgi:hypothetical protein
MKTNFFLLGIILIYSGIFSSGCSNQNNQIIGAKIYEYDGDPLVLIAKWKAVGINTAFISKQLSRNKEFTDKLREFGIPFYIIWPVFQDPSSIQKDSTLFAILDNGNKAREGWLRFVCPSRKTYRQMQVDSIGWYAENVKPDGMSIDFIRQFVYWEMIYPDKDPASIHNACYCDSCYHQFLETNAIAGPDSTVSIPARASFLNSVHGTEWDRFRCDLITSMVRDIHERIKSINSDIFINLHIVPWREKDFEGAITHIAAQDCQELAHFADYISPMCYSQMLERSSLWISDVVMDLEAKAPGKVLASIQVYPYYVDNPFPPDSLRECLIKSLKPPSNGVVFWSWPLLEQDPVRVGVVMDVVKSR